MAARVPRETYSDDLLTQVRLAGSQGARVAAGE